MNKNNEDILLLDEELKALKKKGNLFYKNQMKFYGQLRGFRKPVSILLQDELDGGESRELNAIETNTFRMPR
ncbi:MAG TPA: hypothetical protein EYG73_00975 [Arcobacter sp.]|nr:hypothetical protein [Arcobacter sp.]